MLIRADISGQKKTVLLGRPRKPRYFKKVKKLRVEYGTNIKAWTTFDVLKQYVRKWDKELKHKITRDYFL